MFETAAQVRSDVAEHEAMVYELELVRDVGKGEREADNGMVTPHEQVKELLLKKLRDENQLAFQRA